jgi:hypothetical protein
MKQVAIALASTAGLLVLAGCSSAPYGTAAAPAYRSYVAPNAVYGESYDAAPYGESYETPYDVAPNAQNCALTNKHPSGASC